jgi:ABC-type hemin transport system ATPase subunit
MKTIDGKEVSDEAAQFYDRVKAGERVAINATEAEFIAAEELMQAGLIETQALVWETRVCYVLTGADPQRDAVARVLADELPDVLDTEDATVVADKILAVLK